MPAGLPGSSNTANRTTNPSAGTPIIFDALSGPKGSPFDKDTVGGVSANASTGAMCTGIGFGLNAGNPFIRVFNGATNAADAIKKGGFNDDGGDGVGFADSTGVYIGGGKCTATVQGIAPVVPYTTGFVPGNAGNGGSRDAGAGPAFTCFVGKWVTAVAQVINSGVVETGFVNRSGVTIEATDSVFGSATAAQAAPA